MPCGAKIPVIALFAGAFFADAWWVSATMYLVGILLVLLGALLVKRITGQKYRKSFFIIELPEYKLPSLKRACVSMLSAAKLTLSKQERLSWSATRLYRSCRALTGSSSLWKKAPRVLHSGKYRSSDLNPLHSAWIRCMAACGSSGDRIYRKRKCCRYTRRGLRCDKSDRYG